MDSLPPELLKMIVDEVQRDPRVFRGQRTLAALARTNRTFYSICHPRLFHSPVLGNPKMMMKWSRFYVSRVDPWVICKGTKSLENVIVPKKITFKLLKDRKTSKSGNPHPVFQRLEAPVDENILLHSPFSPFFFRNLTSFVISSDYPINNELVVALFGPTGSKRSSILRLAIRRDEGWHLNILLLEGYDRTPFEAWEMDPFEVLDAIVDGDPDQHIRDRIRERLNDEDSDNLEGGEWDKLETIGLRLARSNVDMAWLFGPETLTPSELLPSIRSSRYAPCHPFSSLRNLTLYISHTFELYLIFYSSLFPKLRRLKLIGQFEPSSTSVHDNKMLRCSITARKGVILPPEIEVRVLVGYPGAFDSWDYLTRKEFQATPQIDYFGPKLSKLDLSDCAII